MFRLTSRFVLNYLGYSWVDQADEVQLCILRRFFADLRL